MLMFGTISEELGDQTSSVSGNLVPRATDGYSLL